MGTNYYAIPKVDEETKIKMKEAIDRNDFATVHRMTPPSIHIGKSSMGWAFIFNHHNWEYFEESLEALKRFLDDSQIENEYREPVPNEEFWELVERKKGLKIGHEYSTIHFGHVFSTSTDFS